ncbi:hypothetical protein [Rhodococcus sp. JS3073]|uniref:hypothetical protein n=1 Tax=Rhodococcus sp. JS3073 TaxID=3002901 RepID=UPI002286B6AD|nr:hypothetical protein [Rhodococcus sp. JS3073]WAM19488.1 hypothetical protein OYT95_44345 [Rhodococcus sp. JS3073]
MAYAIVAPPLTVAVGAAEAMPAPKAMTGAITAEATAATRKVLFFIVLTYQFLMGLAQRRARRWNLLW